MGGTTTRSAYETLARGFENNTVFGRMHCYDLYRAWLEGVWAFLDAVHDPQGFRQCLDRYSRAEGEEFGRLLGIYADAVEQDPFRDILGELFMRLDVNSVKAGQFMTPWHIAEMMARMQFDRAAFEALVEEKGVVTVCDPAVGSGVMLLAFSSVVHATLGRWGTSKLRLYGTDIDIRAWRRTIAAALPVDEAGRSRFYLQLFTRISDADAKEKRKYAFEQLIKQPLIVPRRGKDEFSGAEYTEWRFDIRVPDQVKLWLDTRTSGRGFYSVDANGPNR